MGVEVVGVLRQDETKSPFRFAAIVETQEAPPLQCDGAPTNVALIPDFVQLDDGTGIASRARHDFAAQEMSVVGGAGIGELLREPLGGFGVAAPQRLLSAPEPIFGPPVMTPPRPGSADRTDQHN